MNVIDAWKQAKEGQKIERPGLPGITKVSLGDNSFSSVISQYMLHDENWLADDWQVAKKKITWQGKWGEIPMPIPKDAKITIEWEE